MEQIKNAIKLNPGDYNVLDLGCGTKKYKGKPGQRVIGVDKVKTPCVDVVCDIDTGIPFSNDSIDMIHMDNSLEHVKSFENTMREIYRVLKKGGEVLIKVPHYSSYRAFTLDHKQFFTVTAMYAFKSNDPMNMMFPDIRFSKQKVTLRTWQVDENNRKRYPNLYLCYLAIKPLLWSYERLMNIKPAVYEKFSETLSPFTSIFEIEFYLKK